MFKWLYKILKNKQTNVCNNDYKWLYQSPKVKSQLLQSQPQQNQQKSAFHSASLSLRQFQDLPGQDYYQSLAERSRLSVKKTAPQK